MLPIKVFLTIMRVVCTIGYSLYCEAVMKKLSSVMIALLSGTFLSMPAMAGDYDLTLEMLQNAVDSSKVIWAESEDSPAEDQPANQGAFVVSTTSGDRKSVV